MKSLTGRLTRALPWLSLAAALALTAQAEWELARAVGWVEFVAWCAPVSLDCYVVAAFRAGRDRAWALTLMSAAVFAAHAVPVAFPAGLPWWIAGVCSVIPPIVAWRVHEIGLLPRAVPAPARRTPSKPKAKPSPALEKPGHPDGKPDLHAVPEPRYLEAARALKARGEKVTRRSLAAEAGGGTNPATVALRQLKAAGEA